MYSFDQINDKTGFANGAHFDSNQDVIEYFTVKNMRAMFGGECAFTQDELDVMAERVINNRWNFSTSPANS